MTKILFISNYQKGVGGIAVQIDMLRKNLSEEAYESHIFSTKANLLKRILLFFRLLRLGRKYDVFHIHGCSYWGFLPVVYGVIIGKIRKKRIILTYHGGSAESFFRKYKRFTRFFLNKTDVNIVLSGFLGDIFSRYSIPFTIIPNVVELSCGQFTRKNIIRPNYISLRSLTKIYNVDCILKAFSIVQQNCPEAALTVLGDGDCRENLENLAKNLNLQNVRFLGQIDNKNIYHYLAEADVFLSSPIIDNQPVSILEAYNAGLLVISSRVGGVPYMVEDNKTGLLFESNNHQELAEKMLLAVQNQEHSKTIIMQANKELEKYSWKEIKEKLLATYSEKSCRK